jgi:ferredoxin
MADTIFYYSGTGNSLWISKKLAGHLGIADVLLMTQAIDESIRSTSGFAGIVFPVYIWGVPAPVLDFVKRLKTLRCKYTFAVAVNGGQVSNTLVQLEKAFLNEGQRLDSGFEIKMPSNYIPWGGPGPVDKQNNLFCEAEKKLVEISNAVRSREKLEVEKGPLWQRILFSAIYRMSFSKVPEMDKSFWADDKCNSCGICARVCPADNIVIDNGKPSWRHRCHQCFACLQWCPEKAMQFGKNTVKYERYHHPEIKLKDVIKK